MKFIWCICFIFLFLLYTGEAKAGELAERLRNFPQWEKISSAQAATGDLVYPDWLEGSWQVKSTLVDLVAPLSSRIVTPGFEQNRQYLNKPVRFSVKFVQKQRRVYAFNIFPGKTTDVVVADRAFNGLNLARAYLGDRSVLSVKVDPDSPNRQITLLRGDRQLVSVITGRSTETLSDTKFITTEIFQQLFNGTSIPYFNTVESTTAYHRLSKSDPSIEADQVTDVYLSPQDPDYFTAGSHPVALYRYKLEFFPTNREQKMAKPEVRSISF